MAAIPSFRAEMRKWQNLEDDSQRNGENKRDKFLLGQRSLLVERKKSEKRRDFKLDVL